MSATCFMDQVSIFPYVSQVKNAMNANFSCMTQGSLSKSEVMNALQDFLNQKFTDKSQADAARRMDISEATISRWVNNAVTPKFEQCLKLAKYFKVDPREIFKMIGGNEEKEWIPIYEGFAGNVKLLEPTKKNGIEFQNDDERDLVVKLLEILREDPGGTGLAVTQNVIEFFGAVKLKQKAGLIPAKKESRKGKKARAS